MKIFDWFPLSDKCWREFMLDVIWNDMCNRTQPELHALALILTVERIFSRLILCPKIRFFANRYVYTTGKVTARKYRSNLKFTDRRVRNFHLGLTWYKSLSNTTKWNRSSESEENITWYCHLIHLQFHAL